MTMHRVNNVNRVKTSPKANKVWVHIDSLVQIDPRKALPSGAQYAECFLCKAHGWLEGRYGWAFNMARARTKLKKTHLMHTFSCPVNRYALKRSLQDG